MFSSASDEWYTPQDLYDRLHAEFDFEIDLAAADENTKCSWFYSKTSNSLKKDWSGQFDRGWLNPPYSRGLCAKFIAKAAEERRKGFTTVMLLPARTDTKAFHARVLSADVQNEKVVFGLAEGWAAFAAVFLALMSYSIRARSMFGSVTGSTP